MTRKRKRSTNRLKHCSESQETKRGSILQGSTTAAHTLAFVWPRESVVVPAALSPPRPTQCSTDQSSKMGGPSIKSRGHNNARVAIAQARNRKQDAQMHREAIWVIARSLLSEAQQREPSGARYYKALQLRTYSTEGGIPARLKHHPAKAGVKTYLHVQCRTRTMRPGGARYYMARRAVKSNTRRCQGIECSVSWKP